MSKNKAGTKANREENNRIFQNSLRERKRRRRQRRQAHGVMTLRERASHEFPLPDVESIFGTCPNQKEWDEMHDRAKRRKQSMLKYATKMGPWTLIDGEDPKKRESWIK